MSPSGRGTPGRAVQPARCARVAEPARNCLAGAPTRSVDAGRRRALASGGRSARRLACHGGGLRPQPDPRAAVRRRRARVAGAAARARLDGALSDARRASVAAPKMIRQLPSAADKATSSSGDNARPIRCRHHLLQLRHDTRASASDTAGSTTNPTLSARPRIARFHERAALRLVLRSDRLHDNRLAVPVDRLDQFVGIGNDGEIGGAGSLLQVQSQTRIEGDDAFVISQEGIGVRRRLAADQAEDAGPVSKWLQARSCIRLSTLGCRPPSPWTWAWRRAPAQRRSPPFRKTGWRPCSSQLHVDRQCIDDCSKGMARRSYA